MITNIAAYHFTPIDAPEAFASTLRARAEALSLRGSVLVAGEGLNLFLAGDAGAIASFLAPLREDARFAGLRVKYSTSRQVPFARLKVKVKPEIISFRRPGTTPEHARAPVVEPATLARWLEQGHDDAGRRVVMLHTRNQQEIAYGTFAGALTLPIDKFTDLPAALEPHRQTLKDATVVSFCTGGIRCEKSTNYLLAQGVEEVFHLRGGILKYLEQVPESDSLWHGDCFVFDGRVSLRHGLRQGDYELCHACRRPLAATDRARPEFEDGVSCHHCLGEYSDADRARFRERAQQIRLAEERGTAHLGAVHRPG